MPYPQELGSSSLPSQEENLSPIEYSHGKGLQAILRRIFDGLHSPSERTQQDRFAEQIGTKLLECAEATDPIACSRQYLRGINQANRGRGFKITQQSEPQQIPWVRIPGVDKTYFLSDLIKQIEQIESGRLRNAGEVSRPLRPAFNAAKRKGLIR